MKEDLEQVLCVVMAEALQRLGEDGDLHVHELPITDADAAALIRGHIIDRWYRFAEFGVTSRRDLETITVTILKFDASLDPRWGEGFTRGQRATISFKGTPLEARAR